MARNEDNKEGFDSSVLMVGLEETAGEIKEVGSSRPQPEEWIKEVQAPRGTEKSHPQSAAKREKTKKVEYKRRSFYITDEQYSTIKLIAATSKDLKEKDQSQIVRTAIDQYTKNRKK